MKKFQENNKSNKIIYSRIILFFLILISIFLAYNLLEKFKDHQETTSAKRIAKEKLEELEKQESNLQSKIINLQTEQGIEEDIREKFRVGKEGEELIIIIEDQNSSEEDLKNQNKKGFLDFLKNIF
ncbi:hypothetical protein A2995_01465 [Candidatus Nomurabacteria bacterium RIFCSPLOWO2_01_FULL_33_24]|uniref:Cell division protein FtsL n=1 Tax=Candidatus Nomurabacteria bacterium RIFCSPLOWO2_01_FULL_33_24 TaxID=1801765 RepID=A0A1F6X347_9BACT|nr:MAG: hypothetical protein A2995_01465 [Candidatus Nomurabacteria bacterium RIFCSPLOWO2_01_FULL_33_24]